MLVQEYICLHFLFYSELCRPQKIPNSRKVQIQEKHDGLRLYPVEIIERSRSEDQKQGVKIHYIGWPARYDEWRDPKELVVHDTDPEQPQILEQLHRLLKETLGPSKKDSFKNIRIPLANQKEFSCLSSRGTVCKQTKTKTIYTIRKRNDLTPILGDSWDYRVFNKECDNVYIITSTVKFYIHERKPLTDYVIYPDHCQETKISRGFTLCFNFVVKNGNKSKLMDLISKDTLL